MNLLKKFSNKESDFENGIILIEDYRYFQHQMIEYFLKIIVEYISNKNNNYLKLDSIKKEEIITYKGLKNNELERYTVYTKSKDNDVKMFFRIYFPKLIYNNYYILNGNNYVPLIYIIDKPIIIKENSINLSSLFSSITFNIKENIVNFIGINIDLNNFVDLFLFDKGGDLSLIKNNLKINNKPTELISYFNSIFRKEYLTIEQLRDYIESLFFDEYTKYLFMNCYSNDEIETDNLASIIKLSLDMFYSGQTFNFIDLKNKRLCFMELLFAPIFKKITNIAYQVSCGFIVDEINIDQYIITKNFHQNSEKKNNKNNLQKVMFNGLSGKNKYDTANLYSSLLSHKAGFIKPGMNSPPPSIRDVHETHFGKICPVTISNSDIGRVVSIIPETFVDFYGQFLNL